MRLTMMSLHNVMQTQEERNITKEVKIKLFDYTSDV